MITIVRQTRQTLDWNSEAQRNNFWLLLIKDVQHA